MKEPIDKTLKERFEELNEIPEGFHDDFDSIWATLEPELEEFNKSIAPKPKRRAYWMYAAAAALLFLIIGSLAGMLWQSNRDNRILEALLLQKQSGSSELPANNGTGTTTVTSKDTPINKTIITGNQRDTILLQPVRQEVVQNAVAKKTGVVQKQAHDLPAIIIINKRDSLDTNPLVAPQPAHEDLAISNPATPKLIHRNRPYAAAAPVQQAAKPINIDFYAYRTNGFSFRAN